MNYWKITWLSIIIFLPSILNAQVYAEQKTATRFAQTYVGLNTQFMPASGSYFWNGESRTFPAITAPRITIGGLHFWGHLDFKISFVLRQFGDFDLEDGTKLFFRPGGEFSARYYPWEIKFGKIRPYAGLSLNQMILGFSTANQGKRFDFKVNTSPVIGLSFAFNNWQLNSEIRWDIQRDLAFYTSRTEQSIFELPPLYASIGLVRYFDTSLKEEKGMVDGSTLELEKELLLAKKLNSFSLGIAPSAAYFFKRPIYQDKARQSVPEHKLLFIWEFGLGYLFHKQNWHIGLSYRNYASNRESFDLEHIIRRQSLSLEAFKFIWNYKGFVPFVGPSIGFERWATGEFEGDQQIGTTARTRMISPGIVVGWDINPTPIDTWTLRTNLRYYPFQNINDIEGKRSRIDQFEFNFIQLLVYPQRMINVRKVKRR